MGIAGEEVQCCLSEISTQFSFFPTSHFLISHQPLTHTHIDTCYIGDVNQAQVERRAPILCTSVSAPCVLVSMHMNRSGKDSELYLKLVTLEMNLATLGR